MRSILFILAVVLACWNLFLSSALADDPIYAPVAHSELQALRWNGVAYESEWTYNHPTSTLYPVQLVGVVINNPSDMLDYSLSAASPRWQTFIQAIDPSDFGGTALYMMQKNVKGEAQYYSDSEWLDEMDRLNNLTYGGEEVTLRYGDKVRIEAKSPGLYYKGKFNINEQHMKSSDYDFSITVLERDVAPDVANITLADLKSSDDTSFLFDETRATGCEHYQASLVHLDDLLLEDANDWATNGVVTVKQGDLTFGMKLGLDAALASIDAESLETNPFGVTAILDQEGDVSAGYRLWLTSASGLTTVPEPGSLLLLLGALAGLLVWRARSWRQSTR